MRRTNGWLLAIALVLVIAIAVLATFQYRWLGSLSAAEEERAKGLRDIAAHHFQGDVDREIQQLLGSFQGSTREEVPGRYHDWTLVARDKRLIEGVYIVSPRAIERFDGTKFVQTSWPASFAGIRAAMVPDGEKRMDRLPLFSDLPAIVTPLRRPRPPRPFPRGGQAPPPVRGDFGQARAPVLHGDEFRPPPPVRGDFGQARAPGDEFRPPP